LGSLVRFHPAITPKTRFSWQGGTYYVPTNRDRSVRLTIVSCLLRRHVSDTSGVFICDG